jgi:uncharacterized protein YndB with AHSA1/START domain
MPGTGTLEFSTPGDREVAFTRRFDAPPGRVFDALTRPELISRWIGPRDWSMAACDLDPRPGGSYRFVLRGPDGSQMGWGGTVRGFDPPRSFVATERFDQPWYPGEALITYTLDGQDGGTRLTLTVQYESAEARETALQTPMKDGLAESYNRLAEVLAEG